MLTFRRAFHALKALFSYQAARWGWAFHPPKYPLFLGVEPTTACNLRCPHCISGLKAFTRPTGRLDPQLLEKLLADLHPYLWGVLFYFQGEPLLHPEIGRLIQTATQYRLLTSLSTNGHFFTEEKCYEIIVSGLTHVRISLDGMSQESYARYRKEGTLETVLQGTQRLLAMRKALGSKFPLIEVQFIAFRHNLSEIPLFRQWARTTGVDQARIKTAQLIELTPEAYQAWIPPEKSRYTVRPDNTVQLKEAPPNRCWRLWRAAEVTWDGRVLPCCFDKNAEHTFGSLQETSFDQAWHSPAAQQFRRQVFQRRESVDICRNCSEGIRTWA
jgi:radical SAM protein with 4Fe4S-binding SPASM domain